MVRKSVFNWRSVNLQAILAQHVHQGIGHDERPSEGHGQVARYGGHDEMALAQLNKQDSSDE